jgi:hypothetical protein
VLSKCVHGKYVCAVCVCGEYVFVYVSMCGVCV